jgi:chemotaxis signal transduction protein/ABC-type nitrate/sulfonate/bicarbonate transport system substrate-binding protein
MSSWNPLAKSLEEGTASGAAVLAPIAMDLFAHEVPIKLVLYAHKNGSIFVRNKMGGDYREPYQEFFRGKSFYIPHMLSIHNILGHMFFNGIGLNYGVQGSASLDVNIEIVPPVNMPELIKEHGDACGYLVAEPLGTKAIAANNADLQFLSSELWDNHPCCVITLRREIIERHPEAVYEFTEMLVKAGRLIKEKPDLAAEIGVRFLDPKKQLGLKVPILYNVLTEPRGIRTDDLYPVVEDLDYIQKYMAENMGIGKLIDLDEFVDMRFADQAYRGIDVNRRSSVHMIKDQRVFRNLLYGNTENREQRSKALLSSEGQYLFFSLGDQEYGINILKIQEIIPVKPIDSLPNTESYFKGVMMYRGATVPVIDLALLLGRGEVEQNERCVIIVMELENLEFSSLIGVIVDGVSEVSSVTAAEIDKPKSGGVMTIHDYMIGMAKKGDTVKTLLDMETLLNAKQALGAVA